MLGAANDRSEPFLTVLNMKLFAVAAWYPVPQTAHSRRPAGLGDRPKAAIRCKRSLGATQGPLSGLSGPSPHLHGLGFADAAISGLSEFWTFAAAEKQPNDHFRSKRSIKAWLLFVLSLQPSA